MPQGPQQGRDQCGGGRHACVARHLCPLTRRVTPATQQLLRAQTPPLVRADGGTLTHGELRGSSFSRFPRTYASAVGRSCRGSCWRCCWRLARANPGGRLGFSLWGLRRGGAAGVLGEGRTRCAGDAAGAETADNRRGRGHAGAALPGSAVERRGGVDGRGYASREQPDCVYLPRALAMLQV
jgi:hypothetical protein